MPPTGERKTLRTALAAGASPLERHEKLLKRAEPKRPNARVHVLHCSRCPGGYPRHRCAAAGWPTAFVQHRGRGRPEHNRGGSRRWWWWLPGGRLRLRPRVRLRRLRRLRRRRLCAWAGVCHARDTGGPPVPQEVPVAAAAGQRAESSHRGKPAAACM